MKNGKRLKLISACLLIGKLIPAISGYTAFGMDADFVPEQVTKLYIPISVTSIGEGMFSPLSALTDVYYEGTKEQWNEVQIASQTTVKTEDGWLIPAFYSAEVHFNASSPETAFDFEEYASYFYASPEEEKETEEASQNVYRSNMESLIKSVIDGSNLDSRLGDVGAKYWSWYYDGTSRRDDSWCAVYVSWLLAKVGQTSVKTSSANGMIVLLSAAGCYRDSSYAPKTGDLVFFSENGKTAGHVGVIAVDDGKLRILHGNYSREVSYNGMDDIWIRGTSRKFSDSILGYGDMECYAELKGI